MIFRAAALLSTLAAASAVSTTTTRRLDDEEDISWMTKYAVRYDNCFHSGQLATFRLCPSKSECKAGCSGGGDYLVDLAFFIDAYTEAQMDAREYRCEMARENCNYDDANEAQCYEDAGLEYCEEENEDENDFNLQEYLECKEVEDGIYVGPYCAEDNYSINLAVFTDEDCLYIDEDGATSFFNVMGYDLPYAEESIIEDQCADCNEHALEEDKNDGDEEDEDDVLEQCEELYENSGKCETNLEIDNPDVSSCGIIQDLQESESVTAGAPRSNNGMSAQKKRNIWIGVLVAALVLGCCGLGYYMYLRNNKKEVEPQPVEKDNKPSKKKLMDGENA